MEIQSVRNQKAPHDRKRRAIDVVAWMCISGAWMCFIRDHLDFVSIF